MIDLIHASKAAVLLDKTGIGPVTVAVVYTAWSHAGRVRSQAAFAALAGVNPIPASSGNTIRHRLNRGGDRRLNRVNRPGVSGHFTSFESESERHVIIEAVKQLSARVA